MGSAGRAGPWIRAASKGFGYIITLHRRLFSPGCNVRSPADTGWLCRSDGCELAERSKTNSARKTG